MTEVVSDRFLIPVSNLSAYFHQALREAAKSQRISADQGSIAYLSHPQTDYARSERLFNQTQEGRRLLEYGLMPQRATAIL